nr:immunoglobulin light chain junction region [Macaca mulatta]
DYYCCSYTTSTTFIF